MVRTIKSAVGAAIGRASTALLAVGGWLALATVAPAQTARDIAMHVCNRVAFGPTPGLMGQFTSGALTPAAFITAQLNVNPASDNAEVARLIARLETTGWLPSGPTAAGKIDGLVAAAMIRAVYSDNQLNEVMTRFWNDHFNRDLSFIRFSNEFGPPAPPAQNQLDRDSRAVWHMRTDDDFFRANALGNFDTLLIRAAESVPMLIYLDNYVSTKTNLNENWGRELIELFTMGEKNQSVVPPAVNYTQADVIAVSRCFTGWTLSQGATIGTQVAPAFIQANHDTSAKTLFSLGGAPGHQLNVPAGLGARREGVLVLQHLAGIEPTKDYIVRKLMIHFMGDSAPGNYPGVLAAAKAQWGTRGNIKNVLQAILTSSQFLAATDRWQKVKNPLRFNISMLRTLGVQLPNTSNGPDFFPMYATMVSTAGMGQSIYSFPSPDGYPLTNTKQIGVSGYSDRVTSAERVLPEPNEVFFPFVGLSLEVMFNPAVLVANSTLTPAQRTQPPAVTAFLLRHFFADKALTLADVNRVEAELAGVASATGLAYDNVVREGCELILSLTHFTLH